MRLNRNQRRNQRVAHVVPVEFDYVASSGKRYAFAGSTTNISASGLGAQLEKEFWGVVGHRAPTEIVLVMGRSVVRWKGVVARVEDHLDGTHAIGIQFDRPRYDLVASLTTHSRFRIQLKEDAELALAKSSGVANLNAPNSSARVA